MRWWDHWLKGIDRGVEQDPAFWVYIQNSVPPKAAYETRDGRWPGEQSWPNPNVEATRFYLRDGRLKETSGDSAETLIRSPETVGQAGDEYCMIWLGPEGPTDQRVDDAGSVCFETAPLTGRMEILGAPVLDLTHRDSHEHPKALSPGKRHRVSLRLDDIAYAVPPGHRIRVALSTNYWPMIWPAPEAETITLQEGSSSLSLPLRPTDGTDAPHEPFAEAEAAPPPRKDVLRPATNTRTITKDAETGRQEITILDDFGSDRIVGMDLTTNHVAREVYSIQPGEPLSARLETHWSQGLSRGDWNVRTETYCTLTGDATHFHVTSRIEAYESGELIFEKDFEESVPRNML